FLGWVLTSALTVLLFDIYRYQRQESTKAIAAVPMDAQVLIPYLYMLVFPTLNGIVAGVITWTPIVLASVSMGLSAILTGWRYIRVRTPDPSQ
ncbi:MAG: hypothetical protein ACFFCP_12900, partial [Promethearchaeota archaeon]